MMSTQSTAAGNKRKSPQRTTVKQAFAGLDAIQKVINEQVVSLHTQTVLLANLDAKYKVLDNSHHKLQKLNAAVIDEVNQLKELISTKQKKATSSQLLPALNTLREALRRWRRLPGEQSIFQVLKPSALDDEDIMLQVQEMFDRVQVCVTM
jgi:hypothetical protein